MTKSKLIVSASILSADFSRLENELQFAIDAGIHMFHLDVMDGHFVKNLTFGIPVIRSLTSRADKNQEDQISPIVFDVHLMVANPRPIVEELCVLKHIAMITFHWEALFDEANNVFSDAVNRVRALAKTIRGHGKQAWLAVNPGTEREDFWRVLRVLVTELDGILWMTVQPGAGGQPMQDSVLHDLRTCKQDFPSLLLQVDGGINSQTIRLAQEAGADIAVVGTGVFGTSRDSFHYADVLRRKSSISQRVSNLFGEIEDEEENSQSGVSHESKSVSRSSPDII